MQNHYIRRHVEAEGGRYESNRQSRMGLVDTLLRETSYFLVDLERVSPPPSPFDEGKAVQQCLQGTYDNREAGSWVYLHLFGHAVRQANAIGLLMEESCVREGFQLWRSLFEAYVICEFLNSCREDPQIFRDYICCNLLRAWIQHRGRYNALLRARGKQPHYDELEIDKWKRVFEGRFECKVRDDYSWAKGRLGLGKRPTFKEISDVVGVDDLMILYYFGSKEIHPTLGHRFVLADESLPLRMMPMMPVNDAIGELDLDYLTVKPLIETTGRADAFLSLDSSSLQRLESP